MNLRTLIVVLAAVLALAACSGSTNAIVQTLESVVQGGGLSAVSGQLNPNFKYLRVAQNNRIAVLALGDVDVDPQGPIEVWYSAQKEVLRLQNGRLVGAAGLTTEWRNVLMPQLPEWSTFITMREPYRWSRRRDVMPGYLYGLRDSLTLTRTEPPSGTALVGIDPSTLIWFEERMSANPTTDNSSFRLSRDNDGQMLPAARYAVDHRSVVIYGEQCLKLDFCFSWQRWSAENRPGG